MWFAAVGKRMEQGAEVGGLQQETKEAGFLDLQEPTLEEETQVIKVSRQEDHGRTQCGV